MSNAMPLDDFDGCLQNNLLKCFSTIHKTQFLLGLSRTTIKDKAVVLPNKWHNLYSLLLVLCATTSAVYYHVSYYNSFYNTSTLMFYACSIGTSFQYITYITWMSVARFTDRESNVMIYYSLQKIDRLLKLSRDCYYTDFQAKLQIFTVMCVCTFFPFGYGLHAWSIVDKPVYLFFFGLALMAIYIDFYLFVSFLYYLAVRISIFNKMLKNQVSQYENDHLELESSVVFQKILALVHPSYDHIDSTLEWNRWSECIQEILKSYQMVNDIFNFQILNLTLTAILLTFFAIAAMLVGYRSGLYPLVATVTLAIWDLFYAFILVAAALMTWWMSSQIKLTKMLCIRIMSYNYEGPYHKAASKTLRIIHYKNPKFVVYGLFELDRTLPLSVIGIIASNILVVIQFIVSRDQH